MTYMQEEWLPIDEFPDYVVSNYGSIRNALTGRFMKLSPVQYGMPTVAMMFDGHQSRRSVAGLVANAFIPKPREDFNTPIHLDGDRKNCRIDNLMWRPRWFAVNYHTELRKQPFDDWSDDIRLVQTGEVFEHPMEPAMKYGLLQREIHQSIVNQRVVFPHGYTFVFDRMR